MIGRADIEGSKSNVAMNAWLPQASYPCGNFSDTSCLKLLKSKGSIGHAFTVCIRTENQNQASFCPFALREVSVLAELALGHLRYRLTDVPPQSNSPPDTVFRADRPRLRANAGEPTSALAGAVHGKVKTTIRARLDPEGQRLAQPAAIPLPLHTPARRTQLLEQTFLPRLQVQFADFPYLHWFYRLETMHLGDLLRIWVRFGTKITLSPSDFQGPTGVHRTPQEPRCFTGTTSLSPGKPIPGSSSLTKKRELFPGLPPTSPSSFALPHLAREGQSPCPSSGILTRFPFDRRRANAFLCLVHRPRFGTEFSYLLGPTDPCSTAVHMEPFSTSAFKVLICTRGGSTQAHALGFRAHRGDPPTRCRISPWVHVLRQRLGTGLTLQRHPFSGLVDSAGIVHHLSGPNVYALAPPHRRVGRDGPAVRPLHGSGGGPTDSPLTRGDDGNPDRSTHTVGSHCRTVSTSRMREEGREPARRGNLPRSPDVPKYRPGYNTTARESGSHLPDRLLAAEKPVVALRPEKVHSPAPVEQGDGLYGSAHPRRPDARQVEFPGQTLRFHPFTSRRFHVLLNSLFKVLFNFPSRYLSSIGLVSSFEPSDALSLPCSRSELLEGPGRSSEQGTFEGGACSPPVEQRLHSTADKGGPSLAESARKQKKRVLDSSSLKATKSCSGWTRETVLVPAVSSPPLRTDCDSPRRRGEKSAVPAIDCTPTLRQRGAVPLKTEFQQYRTCGLHTKFKKGSRGGYTGCSCPGLCAPLEDRRGDGEELPTHSATVPVRMGPSDASTGEERPLLTEGSPLRPPLPEVRAGEAGPRWVEPADPTAEATGPTKKRAGHTRPGTYRRDRVQARYPDQKSESFGQPWRAVRSPGNGSPSPPVFAGGRRRNPLRNASRRRCPDRCREDTADRPLSEAGNSNAPKRPVRAGLGSPTETLLRLLLPLSDQVPSFSRPTESRLPPSREQSEDVTKPLNR
ncbi:hypothetical protein ScPMuIL_009303 [Solemya velum]